MVLVPDYAMQEVGLGLGGWARFCTAAGASSGVGCVRSMISGSGGSGGGGFGGEEWRDGEDNKEGGGTRAVAGGTKGLDWGNQLFRSCLDGFIDGLIELDGSRVEDVAKAFFFFFLLMAAAARCGQAPPFLLETADDVLGSTDVVIGGSLGMAALEDMQLQ
jgi:hypothetical protein